MKNDLLELLDGFEYIELNSKETLVNKNDLTTTFKIQNGIPRFVDKDNYSESSFGFQWNTFFNTQLDSYSKTSVSKDRFYLATNWNKNDLKDKLILDVGCGMGRFAEIALESGAIVVCVDYSSAIDACKRNLEHYENAYFIQGDIYNLPFKKEIFDYIYSLGVLQHTPNPEKALKSLYPFLKQGGGFVLISMKNIGKVHFYQNIGCVL